ncbi:unnamed protein product, partial [Ectocarpus sp. 12 AP-2014]
LVGNPSFVRPVSSYSARILVDIQPTGWLIQQAVCVLAGILESRPRSWSVMSSPLDQFRFKTVSRFSLTWSRLVIGTLWSVLVVVLYYITFGAFHCGLFRTIDTTKRRGGGGAYSCVLHA